MKRTRGVEPPPSCITDFSSQIPDFAARNQVTRDGRAAEDAEPPPERHPRRSGLPGIPADHQFLGFLQGGEPPAQFNDVLTHCIFRYSLLFDTQCERLR